MAWRWSGGPSAGAGYCASGSGRSKLQHCGRRLRPDAQHSVAQRPNQRSRRSRHLVGIAPSVPFSVARCDHRHRRFDRSLGGSVHFEIVGKRVPPAVAAAPVQQRNTTIPVAKLDGVNPELYLLDILPKIADGHPINRVLDLMPWNALASARHYPPRSFHRPRKT